jgi:DNA-binding NtrC family response regulator
MGQIRVLLVDDEAEFASTLAERLMLRGIEAEVATSGVVALKHIRQGGFDIMILDVKMPGIDGLELMTEVKRRQPDLPVILLTGHGSVASAKTGIKAGAFDCLMKPIDIDELVEKIKRAADGKEGESP